MDELLENVKPVVSIDVCHIRHKADSIIYTAMVQAGSGDSMPIGIAICGGAENYINWE